MASALFSPAFIALHLYAAQYHLQNMFWIAQRFGIAHLAYIPAGETMKLIQSGCCLSKWGERNLSWRPVGTWQAMQVASQPRAQVLEVPPKNLWPKTYEYKPQCGFSGTNAQHRTDFQKLCENWRCCLAHPTAELKRFYGLFYGVKLEPAAWTHRRFPMLRLDCTCLTYFESLPMPPDKMLAPDRIERWPRNNEPGLSAWHSQPV